jgi:hypothetical protein
MSLNIKALFPETGFLPALTDGLLKSNSKEKINIYGDGD